MNEKNATFEANMQRLEQIVRAMERGDVALEESLKLFQEGTELVRNCQKLLDEAQLQLLAHAAEVFAAAQLERGFRTLDYYKSILPPMR